MNSIFNWHVCVCVALLVSVQPSMTLAQAMCKWVPSVSFCTATVEGPEGDQYVATNVAAGACFSNQNEALGGGCRIEASVCESQMFPPAPTAWCLPVGSSFSTYASVSEASVFMESCSMQNGTFAIGEDGTTCGEYRQTMYTALGCATCAATYEEAFSTMEACYASPDEATCNAGGVEPPAATAEEPGTGATYGKFGGFIFESTEEADLENVQEVPGVATSAVASGAQLIPTMTCLVSVFGAAVVTSGL